MTEQRRTHRFATLTIMNFRELMRDRVAFFFSFFFPLLFAVIFGVGGTSTSERNVRLGILDPEGAAVASGLTDALRAQESVELVDMASDAQLGSGSPSRLAAGLDALLAVRTGPSADGTLRVKVVASDDVAPAVRSVLDAARGNLAFMKGEVEPPLVYEVAPPPEPTSNQFTFSMPGLMAMALLQLGLFATAAPLIAARERGTLRHLSTTPLSRTLLLGSHVALRCGVAAAQMVILIAASLAFGLHVRGNPFTLVLTIALGAVMFIAIGYALAGLVPGRDAGIAIILLVNFSMLLLGQVFFDLGGSSWAKPLTRVVPLTYLSDGLREVVVGTPGSASLWVNLLAMAGWATVAVVIASRTFRFDMRRR